MIISAMILMASTQSTSHLPGEIGERLSKPVIATFTSTKKTYELELCVADAISKNGVPTLLRNGKGETHMMINIGGAINNGYQFSVTFEDKETGTNLHLRGLGNKFPEKAIEWMRACL